MWDNEEPRKSLFCWQLKEDRPVSVGDTGAQREGPMLNTTSELGRKHHPHDTSRVLTTHGDLSPKSCQAMLRGPPFLPFNQSQDN